MTRILAQSVELSPGVTVQGPVTWATNIGAIITKLIPFLFAFAGIGLLLMLLSAGFAFLTSAGDAKKLEQGKQRLTYAIVGFLIIFVAYWIVQIAGFVFGITEITNIFP